MKVSRRSVLSGGIASGAALTLLGPKRASAQAYPNRFIKLIVPWPAGGVTDITGRIIGQRLSVELGKPVVIKIVPVSPGRSVSALSRRQCRTAIRCCSAPTAATRWRRICSSSYPLIR